MNFHKTDIDWCTHTWNPVTGCRYGCDYCYARRYTIRFQPHGTERPMESGVTSFEGGSTGIKVEAPGCYAVYQPVKLMDENGEYVRSTSCPKGFAPTIRYYTLDFPKKRLIPARVFVSSLGDLFGKWVPDHWIKAVFASCREAPQHTYLFLTKNPERYCIYEDADPSGIPTQKNFWYGTTANCAADFQSHCRANTLAWFHGEYNANTFLSIEPLVESIGDTGLASLYNFQWLIIGAMTGPGSKDRQPKREWVEEIVKAARDFGVPVFMKKNLVNVWGDNLIQQYPAGMVQDDAKGPAPLPRCKKCEYATATPQGKRGISYACEIGWEAAGYDDRGARGIPGRYTRTSQPWCPLRGKDGPM